MMVPGLAPSPWPRRAHVPPTHPLGYNVKATPVAGFPRPEHFRNAISGHSHQEKTGPRARFLLLLNSGVTWREACPSAGIWVHSNRRKPRWALFLFRD